MAESWSGCPAWPAWLKTVCLLQQTPAGLRPFAPPRESYDSWNQPLLTERSLARNGIQSTPLAQCPTAPSKPPSSLLQHASEKFEVPSQGRASDENLPSPKVSTSKTPMPRHYHVLTRLPILQGNPLLKKKEQWQQTRLRGLPPCTAWRSGPRGRSSCPRAGPPRSPRLRAGEFVGSRRGRTRIGTPAEWLGRPKGAKCDAPGTLVPQKMPTRAHLLASSSGRDQQAKAQWQTSGFKSDI